MKNVLITGGKRGIGKAIADLLGSDSDLSIFAPSSKEMDVTDEQSVQDYLLINDLIFTNPIDILVNNAGVHVSKPFLQHTEDDFQKIFAVNFFGAVNLCQKVLPHMQSQSWGRIVNISSISGLEAEPGAAAYGASKFALNGLTKTLALEFARDGITVNAICPGWVRTDMALKNIYGSNTDPQRILEKEKLLLGSVAQQRWIKPIEIAHMVKYLISDEAKSITGQTLQITAGLDL